MNKDGSAYSKYKKSKLVIISYIYCTLADLPTSMAPMISYPM